jgi:hypothetical protein
MTTELEQAWRQTLQQLEGRPCWAMLGITHGVVRFHFGAKIRREEPVPNTHLSYDAQHYEGEYGLFVHGCPWRLQSETAVLASWLDDEDADGPGSRALNELVGTTVIHVSSSLPARDLEIVFSNGYVLDVFSDGTDRTEDTAYSVINPHRYLGVYGGGALKSEPR